MTRHISPELIGLSIVVAFVYAVLQVLDFLGHRIDWLPWY